jgi:putative nucleotidyltransferase with HDIG domain
MSDHREKRVELILQQLEELPTLPAVALRVLELTGDDDSSASQIIPLIENDPALSAVILRLALRSDNALPESARTVERAVVMLGFSAVRNAVLAASVFRCFPPPPAHPSDSALPKGLNRIEFWKHCLAVACCAELIAETLDRSPHNASAEKIDPSTAFLCGLLHDIGKIAMDSALPKSFARAIEAVDLIHGDIADVERRVIGLDHLVVGKRLGERWKLPEPVRECAWLHGQHPGALPAGLAHARLVNCITLADVLVREQHLGYSGNYTFPIPRQSLLDAVGLSGDELAEVSKQLVGRIEPRASAIGLDEVDGGEMYLEALALANKELSRLSGQLEAKNRKLAVRAKFFEALATFQSGLHADAPPQDVLGAIAQTAAGVLQTPIAAAFSSPPGRLYVETVLADASGQVVDTSLIDVPIARGDDGANRPALPPLPDAGEGPVLPAGETLEWFVSVVSPRLSGDRRFWICLVADGACIGGIVWGAPAGESQRLGNQTQELWSIAQGWALALRTAQIREESRSLSEQLADTNRQLQSAQAQMLRSRTMVSLGELAAGAAHEMNNPLAVISGRSQLLASQLSDPKLRAAATVISEQSHRLSGIITELMAFAKPQPPTIGRAELADVIGRSIHQAKMQSDPADRTIELTVSDSPAMPAVLVDPEQVAGALEQVIDNAIQATDATSGNIAVHAAYDPYSAQAVITIADDGAGMDEATLKRAFDPFFSSKPAGRRRGLGLAKALRWIEASGGSIRLESAPGQGTRAIVLLPTESAKKSAEANKLSPDKKAGNY